MENRVCGNRIIRLTEDEIKRCKNFARESARTQQAIEFGNRNVPRRSEQEIARDNLIGKLAEVAFANFLEQEFRIHCELDFEIYAQGVWDREDLLIYNQPVDIKATRPGGRWLLVELNKLEFRKNENRLPFCFLFARTGWDRVKDEPTGEVDLTGYALLEQICHVDEIGTRSEKICKGIEGTQFLAAGQCIPNTQVSLQADNCARPVRLLNTDWSSLIDCARRKSRGNRLSPEDLVSLL